MILIQKTQATETTQASEKTYPSVQELMQSVLKAVDVVMTTPDDGHCVIGQICPPIKNGHVSRSTVMAAFKHAITIVKQIETHDAAAAGAVLAVLETVQAALTAPLTLGTAPATATAAPATATAAPATATAAPATAAPAQSELPLESAAPAPAPAPQVNVIKAKKAKA